MGSDQVVCRGIRGATTVPANTAEDILEGTTQMLRALIELNGLHDPDLIASAVFTTTVDLTATFPAIAARDLGWTDVPLMCAHEMDVPGALERVVRVMLHVNTSRPSGEIRHVYLKGARSLRPGWAIEDGDLDAILGSQAR
jgi:chorismate mutase